MKKTLLVAAISVLPLTAMAQTSTTPAFFFEYGSNFIKYNNSKVKIEGYSVSKENSFGINVNGFASVGIDYNGIQLALTPSYANNEDTSEFDMLARLDIPFLKGNIQPFVSLEAGLAVVSIDSADIDDIGFAYGAGFGVKYSFNENLFIKGSFNFSGTTMNTKVYGYDVDITTYGFGLRTSLGYRF